MTREAWWEDVEVRLHTERKETGRPVKLGADIRNAGLTTAHDKPLDGDVILAAQTLLLPGWVEHTMIATTTVAHISRFVPAMSWNEIA